MRRLLLISAALAALAPAPALGAPDGVDAGFGNDGVTAIDFSGKGDFGTGVAVAPDGKIVVVGRAASGGATLGDFGIVRLNPDGTLDETFGSGGKRTIDFKPTGSDSWDDNAGDVLVQPDGKIVVAGASDEPTTDNAQMTITRLNATDGSTDLTFGDPSNPGVKYIGLGGNGTVGNSIDRFANGKFVVAGVFYGTISEDMAWAGLNQLGQEDPISGSVTFQGASTDYASDVAVTPNGNFVAAGGTDGGPDVSDDVGVVRRKGTDGSVDNTFNGNGRTTVGYGGTESAAAVAVQPDNKVLTAGQSFDRPGAVTGRDFLVHRLTAAGSPDTSFGNPGNNGGAFIDFGGQESGIDMALQPDGNVVVAGNAQQGSADAGDVAVARLGAGGALDGSFGVGGKRLIPLPAIQNTQAIALQGDGGILAAGSTYLSNANLDSSDFFVTRIGRFTPRPGAPGSPPPSPSQPRPTAPRLARVAISAKSLEASAKGVVGVKLSCSAAAACAGTVDLVTAGKVTVSAKKRKLTLGRKSYSIRAGKTQTVKVKLNRAGLRVLRKQRKLRVRLTVTTRRARAAATKASKTVTLKAASTKKKKRKR